MKYAIGVNICPTKTSGLCNQLYRILAAIQFASNNNIPIVCIDKFYKQINSDVLNAYCNISEVINMEKFIDGIHVSEISNDNLNEKNMLSNFFHTQHLTITPLVLNGTVLGAVYISENYKKQLVVEIIKIFAIIKNNKVAYMAKYRVIN